MSPLGGLTQSHFAAPGSGALSARTVGSPGWTRPPPLLCWALPGKGGAVLSLGNCRFLAPAAKRKITTLSSGWLGSKGVLSHYLNPELRYD